MAFPILGTPKPQFFDSNGDPLASGTVSILDPSDDSNKNYYDSADDADNNWTSANTGDITLGSDGRPTNQIWGENREDYKIVLKDSGATTIYTIADLDLPQNSKAFVKVKTSDTARTSTTAQIDGELTDIFLYPGGSWYRWKAFLLVTADAASRDIGLYFSTDGAAPAETLKAQAISVDAGNAGAPDEGFTGMDGSSDEIVIDIDGTDDVAIIANGFIQTDADGSQRTKTSIAWSLNSAGTVTMKKGSWFKIERIST